MSRNLIVIFIIVLLFISCKKYGCDSEFIFDGITERDERGQLIKDENADWTLKDKWGDTEKSLFDTTYNTTCYAPSKYTISVHPNPTSGPFQVNFTKSAAMHVDMRLVDADCNVITSIDDIRANSYGMQVNLDKSKIVRLYYRFIEDGCEYQGHGDILVRK